MSNYELVELEPPQGEIVKHDHGLNRDGPCLACEALTQGGESETCPTCGGSGDSPDHARIACMGCGGNYAIVRLPIET